MHTLKLFNDGITTIPAQITWYLSDLSEAKGKQELYTLQSPQKLKVLKEHALIESAVSSNRIEGVEIENKRIGTVLFGKAALKDRNEEEIQGYRNALELIHTDNASIKINDTSIKKLHKLSRGVIWDAGRYKVKDSDIIERLQSGNVKVRFKTVKAAETKDYMKSLHSLYHDLIKNQEIHPLLLIIAYNLDFLCIHPFRDGNGRVSRLLLLLQLYHTGFDVGKYISFERIIEEHKDRYYETLEISSQKWHNEKHDPWPYIGYVLYILKLAYTEFMMRVEKIDVPRGAKTALVIQQIDTMNDDFSISALQNKCPTVSKDMVKKILQDLKKKGKVASKGKGVAARWSKTKLFNN
jgi:Fic family protein